MRSARSSSPPPSASRSRSADRRAARGGAAQRRDRHGPCASAMAATGSRCSGPTMRSDRSDHFTMETDLRHALDRNEMKVLFKPIVRLEDRTIAGFESMLRWDHPRLGRDRPRGLHVDCRGNRPDRQAERVPAGADRPRTRRLAERARGRAADLRQRQHVEPSPAAPRSAAGREDGHRPHAASCPARSRSR